MADGAMLTTEIDDKLVKKAFNALSKALAGNTTPVMAAIGTALVRNVHDRFAAAVDPSGMAWAPLNPGYAAGKKGPGILREGHIRSGLMGSITFVASPGTVEVGTNKPYAAAHQFGVTIKPVHGTHLRFMIGGKPVYARSVTIPARPYLGISAEDERTIAETVTDALDRATKP